MIELSCMNKNKQYGAVSLFVVVFAALLITVVTVSFVRIMLQDQRQASSTDLSQSAYDSAQAGVEDAKRALVRYQSICAGSDASACADAKAKLDSSTCNEAVNGLKDVDINDGEVKVQEGSANKLNQAYTCVKIILDTVDYLGALAVDGSKLIPLESGPDNSFNTIKIEWFSKNNLPDSASDDVVLQPTSSQLPLLPQSGTGAWQQKTPSIMRAQLVQIGSNGFSLGDFDSVVDPSGQSNANTLFLYPVGITGQPPSFSSDLAFSNDTRRNSTTRPRVLLPVQCSGTLASGGYACSVTIKLPDPVGGGKRTAFLRLSSLYNKANYRVTMFNIDSANGVDDSINFNAVQPEIDSTGRANDLFRRVKVRVELSDVNFPYPDGAIDISGNFCKDFMVTDDVADYDPGTCKP